VYVKLVGCYRAKILGKEVKYISADSLVKVTNIKAELEKLDPNKLPQHHLLILREKRSMLDHEPIKGEIPEGTLFDVQYRVKPGGGR